MRLSRVSHRIAAFAVATTLLLIGFFAWVRPWFLDWGATGDEQRRALPGDEIVPHGSRQTRAIDIAVPPAQVWPWLAQNRARPGWLL